MKHILLVFVSLLSLCLSAAVLVENGRADAEIILPAEANPVEKFAAVELALHLKMLGGAEIPVHEAPTGTARVSIRLGRAAELSMEGQPLNAGHIRVSGDVIEIAGVDGDGDPMRMKTSAGTLFAVYEFLEGLGVRWLWPGDLGTYVPKLTTIEIPDTDHAVPAPLPFLSWRFVHKPKNWIVADDSNRFLQQETLWLRRHRFNEVTNLGFGHAFTKWYGQYGESNPEYFNLLPDGTRRPEPIGRFPNRPDLISMCVSNPDLTKKIVSDWVAKGPRHIINLNENDTAGKCTCPACLAWDCSDDADRLTRAQKRFAAGDGLWYKELGSLSERYARWYLDVLAEADRVAPDANVRVIGCIYANYFEPPVKNRLNERVLLRFCPPLMYPWTPKKVADFKRLWQGWHDAGVQLMLRPNFTLDGHGFPLLFYRDFIECFDFAHANGMIAVDLDSLTGMYGANGLTTYAIATKFMRPEATADQILEEYLLAFGPAVPAMRKFLALMEEATHAVGTTENNTIEGGRYADFYQVAGRVFTPEVMRRGAELLEEASKLAADAHDDVAFGRVSFVRLGFEDAAMVLDTQAAFEDYKRSFSTDAFVAALKKLLNHRSVFEAKGYANIGFLNMMEGRVWPLHLALLGSDSHELTGWEIRFDPQRDGEDVGCVDGRGDGWQAIVTDRQWELSEPGLAWEKTHGAPHKGVAWYRCHFKVRNLNPSQQMKLTFGAVDGNADIWLNGKHIGTHEFPYKGDYDSWKKPYDIDATNAIRDGENLLVVRVDKRENGLSGIWRPVFLSMGAVAAESLSASGWKPHTPAGKIAYQSMDYPLTINAYEADVTKLNSYRGVWGRLYRSESVKPGQYYQVQCTYRTPSDCKAKFAIWLRSGNGNDLNAANVNFNAPATNGDWRTLKLRFLPEKDVCSIYLTLVEGIGKVQIREFTLVPVGDVGE